MKDLYAELKDDIEALAGPLFEASQVFLRKRGSFLPHGAVLESSGKVRLVMAVPDGEDRAVSPAEILPLLHDALRLEGRGESVRAVAVCEDVTITPQDRGRTPAIKVLVEHRRGFTSALYLPYQSDSASAYWYGEMLVVRANPEVRAWPVRAGD